jgi:hypothetical protein
MTIEMANITHEQGKSIKVMFNPDSITYTKANSWTIQPTNGQPLPEVAFASSTPATLVVTLIFDGTEKGDDVAKMVDELAAFTKVDESLTNGTISNAKPAKGAPSAPQHRPPTVRFMWGTFLSFKAVISRLVSHFTLFLDNGTPVRASVEVTFQQVADDDAFKNQNPTSGGRTGERVHRLGPRETLDQVAYAVYGQTSLWRGLAAFNGIDDPLRVQAGDAILLPASAEDLKALS